MQDENGMKLWFEKIWSRRRGCLLKKPTLLVLDQFWSHITEPTKNVAHELKTELAVIPGGLFQESISAIGCFHQQALQVFHA
jgi:hypothetical protein